MVRIGGGLHVSSRPARVADKLVTVELARSKARAGAWPIPTTGRNTGPYYGGWFTDKYADGWMGRFKNVGDKM